MLSNVALILSLDWAQLFQTKCYGCQFPIEPGDRWVEALGQNWHSECFNCSVSASAQLSAAKFNVSCTSAHIVAVLYTSAISLLLVL